MSHSSRRPTVHRFLLPCFLLLALALVTLATFNAPAPKASASGTPGFSEANKHLIPMIVPIVAINPVRSKPKPAIQSRLRESYGKLPLSFEANQGQTNSKVKFLSRGNGYSLFLTSTEAVLALTMRRPGDPETRESNSERIAASQSVASLTSSANPKSAIRNPQSTVLRMKLVGANPTRQMTGLDELAGHTNYFIGNDPKNWRTNVPTYARVKHEAVYPGVDLVYYGNQRQLEYDFL